MEASHQEDMGVKTDPISLQPKNQTDKSSQSTQKQIHVSQKQQPSILIEQPFSWQVQLLYLLHLQHIVQKNQPTSKHSATATAELLLDILGLHIAAGIVSNKILHTIQNIKSPISI